MNQACSTPWARTWHLLHWPNTKTPSWSNYEKEGWLNKSESSSSLCSTMLYSVCMIALFCVYECHAWCRMDSALTILSASAFMAFTSLTTSFFTASSFVRRVCRQTQAYTHTHANTHTDNTRTHTALTDNNKTLSRWPMQTSNLPPLHNPAWGAQWHVYNVMVTVWPYTQ